MRLTTIDHRDALGSTIRSLEYTYEDNNLVKTITESDVLGLLATVTFGYDSRGRLTSEVRTGENAYNYAYEYDQGGNRTLRTKTIDPYNKVEDRYHYDVEDPPAYGSDNNRLMYYETWKISPSGSTQSATSPGGPIGVSGGVNAMRAPPGGGDPIETLVSTSYYYYNAAGNVIDVITEYEGVPTEGLEWARTSLHYAKNGRVVTHVFGQERLAGQGRQTTYVREFRYDGARQRYLDRDLVSLVDTWSDYDGDEVYGDFTVSGGAATDVRSFQLGIGRVEPWSNWGGANTEYYHADIIGTTRHMTDPNGSGTGAAVYTAFGERVSGTMGGSSDRYGFAGTSGYQEKPDFPFLHAGDRYHDPAVGRFL